MKIEEGQVYESMRSSVLVRVLKVDSVSSRSLVPSAWVENVFGPKRGRWVRLKEFHTDAKSRRTGYRLILDADGARVLVDGEKEEK